MKHSILIIDDEKNIRELFKETLGGDYIVLTASSGEEGVDIVKDNNKINLAFIDKNLPGIDGIKTFKRIAAMNSNITGIIITAFGEVKDAVSALKLGVFDYLLKPLKVDEIRLTVKRALEDRELRKEVSLLREKVKAGFEINEIIGESDAIKKVKDLIIRAAGSDAPALIQGDSGTGKELAARAIHYSSERGNKPLIEVNCAAIPKDLIEAELFGHVKGAFTGTVADRKGFFEQADGGTLFLDEIGDMALDTQAKILRAIENHRFRPIGGTKDIEVDVRIIAATNKDIKTIAKEGSFREDLYYRINVIEIRMPALAERKEDIPLLVNHFLQSLDKKRRVTAISPDAMTKLRGMEWRGNVRELKNAVERMIIACDDGIINEMVWARCLGIARNEVSLEKMADAASQEILGCNDGNLKDAINEFSCLVEKGIIEGLLQKNNGNQNITSEAVGISRQALYEKIKKYGVEVEKYKKGDKEL